MPQASSAFCFLLAASGLGPGLHENGGRPGDVGAPLALLVERGRLGPDQSWFLFVRGDGGKPVKAREIMLDAVVHKPLADTWFGEPVTQHSEWKVTGVRKVEVERRKHRHRIADDEIEIDPSIVFEMPSMNSPVTSDLNRRTWRWVNCASSRTAMASGSLPNNGASTASAKLQMLASKLKLRVMSSPSGRSLTRMA